MSDTLGDFSLSPAGPFEAGSYTTITFRVRLGERGLPVGGRVKVSMPDQGWGEPICLTPREDDDVCVGTDRVHNPWKPINTTWRLKTKSNATLWLRSREANFSWRNLGPEQARERKRYSQWRWWITATVEREDLAPGDEIVIVYGDTDAHPRGVRTPPWYEEETWEAAALIDVNGDGLYRELAGSPVEIALAQAPPERVVVALPSLARPGETIPVRLNVTDRNYCPPSPVHDGDLTLRAEGPASLTASRAKAGEEVPALVNGPGVARVRVRELDAPRSNPVVIDPTNEYGLYWGDLHSQSRYHMWWPDLQVGHSSRHPAELHAYARDCSFLDFIAITDSGGICSEPANWEETLRANDDCYEPGRYVTLKGWECAAGVHGDKCVVYRSNEPEPAVAPEVFTDGVPTRYHGLIRYYRNHPERVLTIPHSFMKHMDWSIMDPELDRVMEVYSCWGAYESRRDSTLNTKRRPRNQSGQHALRTGLLLGFTAAGDSHIGYPGRSLRDSDRNLCQNHKAGVCGVFAKELTREAVWDALYDRHCYGTTGAKIVVRWTLNGERMGSVIECPAGDPRLTRREIRVRVAGTDLIRRVDVLKNNALLHRETPGGDHADFTVVDQLDAEPTTRDGYYVRLYQADANAAWASPVWIGPEGCATPTPTDLE